MKKITFLVAFLLTSVLGFAQLDLLQNFETGGLGATFGSSSASLVANPSGTGQVAMLSSNAGGTVWQGVNISLSQNVQLTTNKSMTMDVYSLTPISIAPKVVGGLSSAPDSTTSASHTGSGWETLTFTFNQGFDNTTTANGVYSGFVIYYNWNTTTNTFGTQDSRVFYVDNIKGTAVAVVPDPAPTTAAPTPPARPAADVKSIFSGAYTPIVASMNYAGVDGQTSNDNTFNTSWCGATTTLVQIDGNDTNKVTGLGCEGVSFLAGRFDATDFTHFHIDMWTSSATLDKSFNIKFSNWNGGTQETNALEYSMTNANVLTNPNPGTWYSFDIPLSSFTCVGPGGNPCPSRTDFTQFIITSNLGTVYYDNLYLHKATVLNTNSFDVSKVKLYPNPTSNILNIEAAAAIQSLSIVNILGQEVISRTATENMVSLDVSNLQSGIYVVKTTIDGVVSSTKFIKE